MEPTDRREKWNIGYKKRSTAGGLISDQCHLFKNKKINLISPNPVFQHSIIPVPHGIRSRQTTSEGQAFHVRINSIEYRRFIPEAI